MKNWKVFFLGGIWMVCSLVARGQGCQEMVDSMAQWQRKGDYQKIAGILKIADSTCLQADGKDGKLYCEVLSIKGSLAMEQGKYQEALNLFKQVSFILKKISGEASDVYGGILNNIATALAVLGALPEALSTIDSSLEIARLTVGVNSFEYGNRLNSRGFIYFRMSKLNEALTDLTQSLEIHVKLSGKNNYDYVIRVVMLCNVLTTLAKADETIALASEARQVALQLRGDNDPAYLIISAALGSGLQVKGRYQASFEIMMETLSKAENVFGKFHSQTMSFRNALALAELKLGRYEDAILRFDEMLNYERSKPRKDNLVWFYLLNNLASIHGQQGNFHLAYPLFQEALAFADTATEEVTFEKIIAHGNLGNCLLNLDNVLQANIYLNEMMEMEKQLGYDFYVSDEMMRNEGFLFHQLGNEEDAMRKLQEGLAFAKTKTGEGSLVCAGFLGTMANVAFKSGKIEEATVYISEALSVFEKSGSSRFLDYVRALRLQALIHQKNGKPKKALHTFEQAMSAAENSFGKTQKDYVLNAISCAALHESFGDTAKARQLYSEAGSIYYQLIDLNFAALGESGVEFFAHEVAGQFDRWKSYAYRHHLAQPEVSGMLYDDELALKGLLLNSARAVQESIQASGDAGLEKLFREWRNLKQMLAHQYSLPVAERSKEFPQKTLDSLALKASSMEAELTQRSAAFRSARQVVDWQDIRDTLRPGEAAVEFMRLVYHTVEKPRSRKHPTASDAAPDSIYYCALVVRPGDKQPQLVPLFEEKLLAAQLRKGSAGGDERFDNIYRGDKSAAGAPNFSHLYRLIWQPLESLFAGDSIIYYAPAGLLHRVAFPAIARTENELLLDRYDLRQMGSTREIVFEKPLHGKDIHTAWVFGGIRYETDSLCLLQYKPKEPLPEGYVWDGNRAVESIIPYLPGSKTESVQVGGKLEKHGVRVRYLEGCEAMEERFEELGKKELAPDVLHVPTHGFFCDTTSAGEGLSCPAALSGGSPNPLFRSGLLFAGAQKAWTTGKGLDGFEDGILYAYQAAGLDLTGTKLVVLSACETGLGDLRGGEGVYGLQRAFRLAGAQRVVMSLWKISDSATVEFMETLYEHWLGGLDLRAAFFQTQKQMREDGRHPYLWAGFVLM